MKPGLPAQWLIGGSLLVIGGLLSLVGAVVFAFASGSVGSVLTFVGLPLEGAGLVTVSFGFGFPSAPVWPRRVLLVTGVLVVVELVTTLVELSAPGIADVILSVLVLVVAACLLIAALGIFRGIPSGGSIRWALLPVAIFEVIDVFLLVSGSGGQWWALAILGALYALAGVVFVTRGPRAHSS